jgi:hypothetical protein
MGADVVTEYGYDEINRLTRETTCDYLNAYYYDDGGNRTKFVHMNAVYSKDGNGRIVSMLTKASQSVQGLTKMHYHANYTERTGSWKDFLAAPTRAEELAALRRHERTGRPLGSEAFVEKVGVLIGRDPQKKKPGKKVRVGWYDCAVP